MNAENFILILFGITIGYGFFVLKSSGLLRDAWLGLKGGKMMKPHQPCDHQYYGDKGIRVVKCDLCGDQHWYDKEDEFKILGFKNLYSR
mgnify:CR=1 FL=1